jgi:hypothetical protein
MWYSPYFCNFLSDQEFDHHRGTASRAPAYHPCYNILKM